MDIPSKGTSRSDENYENKKEEVNNSILLDEITVLYTNADSLMNKRQELLTRISVLTNKPHIIAITEVKSKKKMITSI